MPTQTPLIHSSLQHYENWNWPYDTALEWMNSAREQCTRSGTMSIAVGSHSRDLVTLGRHASDKEILDAEYLSAQDIRIYRIDRGGGATLHGPKQVVLYPVVSIETLHLSIPELTTLLEEAMRTCLRKHGIDSHRIEGEPGVFVNGLKIGSIGLRISQSIVTHGISLNVDNDLSLYRTITPCSKANAAISSMAAFSGEKFDVDLVGRNLKEIVSSEVHLALGRGSPSF